MQIGNPLVILVVGIASALVVSFAVSRILRFRRLSRIPFISAARKPLSTLIFAAIALRSISGAAEETAYFVERPHLAKLLDQGLSIIWLVLFIWAVIKFSDALFKIKRKLSSDASETQRALVARKLTVGLSLILGLIFGLRALGIDTGPLLTGGAIGGVIIGLALQESLANVFSGLLFTMDGAVRVGDLVRLGSGKEGFVHAVGWRSTLIRLHDETLLVVPNAVMSRETVENLSRTSEHLVVSTEVNVKEGEDLSDVESVAIAKLKEVQASFAHDRQLREPWVRWRQIGDTGVVLKLFLPIGSVSDESRARSALIREVHDMLSSRLAPRVAPPTVKA